MRKIRWGIIGSGKIAGRFASDLTFVEDAELFGVAGRNAESVRKFAEDFRTRASSLEELLASDVDVIYVATPHSSHYEYSLEAMRAGKAVLCEKPFTLNAKEARLLFQEGKARNVFVMEAMWTRFFPAIVEILDLVKQGAIGELTQVESSFGYKSEFNETSRIYNPELGGGSLLDVGVYSLALVRMLTEEKGQMQVTAKMSPTGVDESAAWAINFPSGLKASGSSSVTEVLGNEARLTGTRGEILIPQFWCPKEYFFNGTQHSFRFEGRGFQFEAREVMRCLRRGVNESELHSHRRTLDVMEMMDSMRATFPRS